MPGGGDLDEQIAVERVLLDLGAVDKLEHRRLGELDALAQQARVDAVREVALRLSGREKKTHRGRGVTWVRHRGDMGVAWGYGMWGRVDVARGNEMGSVACGKEWVYKVSVQSERAKWV